MNSTIVNGLFAGYLRGLEKTAASQKDVDNFNAILKAAQVEGDPMAPEVVPAPSTYSNTLQNAIKNTPKAQRKPLLPVTQRKITQVTGGPPPSGKTGVVPVVTQTPGAGGALDSLLGAKSNVNSATGAAIKGPR